MKNALMIALALTSMTAFAGTKINREQRKVAVESCKAEGKTKNDLKACVKEKLGQPSATQPASQQPATK
ncbi:hypothetical protein C0V70_12665 [Bacteriovorax stolpii]|uniref:Uncharacterized protein n=1 Tax=Bacteriovorax stolpii TaxID=960 RepID=A0A2K9NTX3_BACTC|nr:hypothetical protein [Bacteriovorax stolpii]AUN98937.1 hypothetical protein C0V70_12665 [Bacteriovorax stolpii]TDP55537.1 hypothetical protein C8D79_0591 [Bacteriovorax stolpii]